VSAAAGTVAAANFRPFAALHPAGDFRAGGEIEKTGAERSKYGKQHHCAESGMAAMRERGS
jgi:hypothetical protein